MRKHIQIISEWSGRLRRRKWWNHPATHPMASTNTSWAMSFFPLQKLKGSQLATTPSAQVAHLEKESTDKEECIDSEDPDGIKGVTKEFIACLARAVKNAQQEEKHCYHCSSPDHFICDCLLLGGSRTDLHLNQREQMTPKKAPGWDT